MLRKNVTMFHITEINFQKANHPGRKLYIIKHKFFRKGARQAAGADFALSEKLTENALLAVGRQ